MPSNIERGAPGLTNQRDRVQDRAVAEVEIGSYKVLMKIGNSGKVMQVTRPNI